MREYELTYLVSDEVPEADLKKITDKVASFISGDGGKITKDESWGRRKLAYPIAKQNFATYITVWFELPKEKIVDIEHELRVNPQIIRHLIVVKITKSEELVVTKEDVVGAEDVEKVLGEKSFEVVEGKKDESYDLMAKRLTTQTGDMGKIGEDKDEKEVKDDKKIEKEPVIKKPSLAETTEDKPKKKISKKAEKEEVIEKEPVEAKKEPEPSSAKATDGKEDEADRIKKLDEKLDELLKDDL